MTKQNDNFSEMIERIRKDALSVISECNSVEELKEVRTVFLGRKGIVNELFKNVYGKTE